MTTSNINTLNFSVNLYCSYQQILQYHMEHNEYLHVIEVCKRFGYVKIISNKFVWFVPSVRSLTGMQDIYNK